jgi:hypothetical protein
MVWVRCLRTGGDFFFCFETNIYDEIIFLEYTDNLP